MTLKEQERLFCLAIINSLKIDDIHKVMTKYIELRDTEKGRIELERLEKMTEGKQEVNKEHLKSSTKFVNAKSPQLKKALGEVEEDIIPDGAGHE